MSGLHTLGRRYGGPGGGVYGRRGDVDMVTPAWLRPRLGRMAPLKILVFTVVLIITLLFMLNARAQNRHMIPHDALNLTDLDFEGVPQTQPDLIAYIRQLHLRAPPLHGPFYTLHHPDTTDPSQNGQSLRVAQILKGKRDGFFVEAGAYNGEDLSNTLYLERQLGWTGLLVEPDPWNFWYLRNRKRRVHSIHACLSPNPYPREVTFRQSDTMGHILQPEEGGRGLLTRVKCFPLYSLLLALNASSIDFLSLDIEGAELQVLRTLPWSKVQIAVVCVEYKHVPEGAQALKVFLQSKGYVLVDALGDDYIFVKKELVKEDFRSSGRGGGEHGGKKKRGEGGDELEERRGIMTIGEGAGGEKGGRGAGAGRNEGRRGGAVSKITAGL